MSSTNVNPESCPVVKTIPSNTLDQAPLEFVYLLQEREFIRLNESTYKVGKTTQPRLKRFDQYPNGSEVLFFRCVENSSRIESLMLEELRRSFTLMKCYGSEYFNGNKFHMIRTINRIIDQEENKDTESKEDDVPLFTTLFETSIKKHFRFTNVKEDYVPGDKIYRKINEEMTMSATKFGREMMKLLPTEWAEEEKRKNKKIDGRTTLCYFGVEEIQGESEEKEPSSKTH